MGTGSCRSFLGSLPSTSGENNFDTWIVQAVQAIKEWEVADTIKRQIILGACGDWLQILSEIWNETNWDARPPNALSSSDLPFDLAESLPLKLIFFPDWPKRIDHLLWFPTKDKPPIMCPSLSVALNLWDRVRSTHRLKSPHSPLAPILNNYAFTPGLPPQHFHWWTNKWLLHMADLCNAWGILSRQTLWEVYYTSSSEHFRYAHISHFLKSLGRHTDLTAMMTMEHLCKNINKIRGHISVIYGLLTSSSANLQYIRHVKS